MTSNTSDTPPPAALPSGLRKVVAAAMIGTIAEWYEFFLYGTASALVFGPLFFARGNSQIDGLIAAFALYAVGFLARPLGGLVFGHLGDKYGRKHLLQLSLIMVGVTTFLMGCLPGFDNIGYAAPILLVILRLIQGFAFGGEWGGAILLVSEHSPADRRGYWASWPQAGVPAGNLIATIVLLLLSSNLSEADFLAWGWRIAFWFSAVVVLIGYWVRSSVDDAPIFKQAQAKFEQQAKRQPGLVEVLKYHWRAVLVGLGARLVENILYYIITTFSITYLKLALNKDTSQILLLMFGAHALHFFFIPLMGYLSDRLGRKPIYLAGSVLAGLWGFIAFPLMNTGQDSLIILAIILGLLVHSMTYAPYAALVSEIFPTHVRYTALSLCYQSAPIVAGSLAPLIAISLLKEYQSSTPIAIYVLIAAVLSTLAMAVARETRGRSLYEVDQETAASHQNH